MAPLGARQGLHEQGVFLVIFQIELLPHSPKSPDLNPIENIWSLTVRSILEGLRQSARWLGPDELWQKI